MEQSGTFPSSATALTERDASPQIRPSVVFVATHQSGGVAELWANLSEALRARGFASQGLAFYASGWVGAGDEEQAWPHLGKGPLANPFRAIRLVAALARWLAKHRPGLVVTAMPAANVLVPLVARWASPSTRVAISHHSPIDTHSRLLSRIDALTGQLRNVCAIISVSHAVAASLDEKPAGYRAKRVAIRNALPPDIEAYLAAITDPVRHVPARRRLVATGRLAYQKNYPMLLRAVALLEDVTLDVVGTGPDSADLAALAQELAITDRVNFLGARPRRDALELLARGDIFVQVSRFEGHSLGLIEAARVGLPLVVSDVPEQVEAVTAQDGTRCGIVVPLDDHAALATAIRSLLNAPDDYAAWSAKARRIAEEARFESVVDAYEALGV